MFRRHPVLSVFTLGYLAAVAFVTLGPQPLDGRAQSLVWRLLVVLGRWEATDWVTYGRLEFMANIAMFLPIGLFFLLLFGRKLWWLAVLLSLTLTVGIEMAQLTVPGRVTDPRDLMANSVGAVIGVLAGLVLTAGAAKRLRMSAARPKLAA